MFTVDIKTNTNNNNNHHHSTNKNTIYIFLPFFIYVCTYIYKYVYLYVYITIYIYVFICVYNYIYIYMYVYVYITIYTYCEWTPWFSRTTPRAVQAEAMDVPKEKPKKASAPPSDGGIFIGRDVTSPVNTAIAGVKGGSDMLLCDFPRLYVIFRGFICSYVVVYWG